MANRLDHEKASKTLTVRRRGADAIGSDATLSRSKLLPVDNSPRAPPGREKAHPQLSGHTYKHESLAFAEAEARRLEAEKANGPHRPKRPAWMVRKAALIGPKGTAPTKEPPASPVAQTRKRGP